MMYSNAPVATHSAATMSTGPNTPMNAPLNAPATNGEAETIKMKILVVGECRVGKTDLIKSFTEGRALQRSRGSGLSTIGAEFSTKDIRLRNGVAVRAQIWDMAGHERYRAVCRAHYGKAHGALVVYDITNRTSFLQCQQWITELRHGNPRMTLVLVGQKKDMNEHREVAEEEAMSFAEFNDMNGFVETSVATCEGTQRAFTDLIHKIYFLQINPAAAGPTDLSIQEREIFAHLASQDVKNGDKVTMCSWLPCCSNLEAACNF
uniref:Uncharacterized protein n=1 Tax=Vitrella brassicaformis TaxID=1169539 RepID=A0A7S1K6E0_9ALVE|mmetsp:Transcript_40110/g.100393  ORF Transcript_40110/g.100393 Transcript_40110/m.100393 type:complete len:263 (+) Transcript_40110:117-905(+)